MLLIFNGSLIVKYFLIYEFSNSSIMLIFSIRKYRIGKKCGGVYSSDVPSRSEGRAVPLSPAITPSPHLHEPQDRGAAGALSRAGPLGLSHL